MMITQVEAKRAVPRSETLKDPGPPTPPTRTLTLNAPPSHILLGIGPQGSHHLLPTTAATFQPTLNPQILSSNKIFVGGLHYETKDGE